MKRIYMTILSSFLSKTETKKIGNIEDKCENDIEVYKLLCAERCFLFMDWAEGYNCFDDFSAFIAERMKVLAELNIKDFHKVSFQDLLRENIPKGGVMFLMLKHFKREVETYGFVLVNLDLGDDTYRIGMAKESCAKEISKIEFMNGHFTLL